MESPRANPIEKFDVPKIATTITEVIAATKCPPTRFLGWAKGESGTANKSTADAPNDPTNKGCPNHSVTASMDQMERLLLIKLHIANFKEILLRLILRGAFIFDGNLLSRCFILKFILSKMIVAQYLIHSYSSLNQVYFRKTSG